MKKQLSNKEKETKKEQRNQLILGLVLIFVMFGSAFGVVVSSFGKGTDTSNQLTYRGYDFTLTNNFWVTYSGNTQFAFLTKPDEEIILDNLTSLNYINTYEGYPLYISTEDKDAEYEIYLNFNEISERIQEACLENETCTEDIPTKNCNNKFIIIKEGDTNEIIQKNNCVFITGEKDNLVKLTDEFIYKISGIKYNA